MKLKRIYIVFWFEVEFLISPMNKATKLIKLGNSASDVDVRMLGTGVILELKTYSIIATCSMNQ